ncbi:MAG: glycoside-pentoside-hexuronide (GPH):cation symporter [Lachnospiraceae bacterium]|nr:glycoside-pentoside-hexuronide (GPH):cation symporter [Lachnospiraceae bacterium]
MNTNSNAVKETNGFLWRQRLGYGSIDLGRTIAQSLGDIYLNSFLLTVVQLPAATVAAMFLICKIIDAITDFVIGILVDRTNTKMGRCRPWVVGGCFVFAVGVYALFQGPNFDSTSAKVIYMYVSYILYTFGLTLVNIPVSAVLPMLSRDPKQYNTFGAARGWSSSLANVIVANAVTPLVIFFGAGSNELLGYSRVALLVGVVEVVLCLIGVMMIKEVNIPIRQEKKEKTSLSESLGTLGVILRDKNFIAVFLFCICNLINQVATASTMIYYTQYILNFNFTLMGLAMTAQSAIGFLCPAVFVALGVKMKKKNIVQLAGVVVIVGLLSRYLTPSFNVMLIVGMAVYGLGMGVMNTSLMSMQPDVLDSLTAKTGKQMTGMVSAMFSLGCQIGSGLSSSLVTMVLLIGGFDGSADVQTAGAITSVKVAFSAVAVTGVLIVLLAMFAYDLDDRMPEIHKKLDELRGGMHHGSAAD